MIDWFMISLGLVGFVLAVSGYFLSALTLNINPEVSRVLKISCIVTTVAGTIFIVLAFLH